MVLVRSILFSLAVLSAPSHGLAASSSTSQIHTEDHMVRVRVLVAETGLGRTNQIAGERFKEYLLNDIVAEAGAPLTPENAARFEEIVSPLCKGIVANLNEYTAELVAPMLTPQEVEEVIKDSASPLSKRFVAVMSSKEIRDREKFEGYARLAGDEIIAAMKNRVEYTPSRPSYEVGSAEDDARQMLDVSGNKRSLEMGVDEYYVYVMLKPIDKALSLDTIVGDEKVRLKSMIASGKQFMAAQVESFQISHLISHFSPEELQEMVKLSDTDLRRKSVEISMATRDAIVERRNLEFEAARQAFFAKYNAIK